MGMSQADLLSSGLDSTKEEEMDVMMSTRDIIRSFSSKYLLLEHNSLDLGHLLYAIDGGLS